MEKIFKDKFKLNVLRSAHQFGEKMKIQITNRLLSIITALLLFQTLSYSQDPFQPQTTADLQTALDLWVSDNASAQSTYGEINTWDVSLITDMSYLFSGSYNNPSLFNDDISNWDVSNVTNMNSIFAWAGNFNGDLSSWDVSSVTQMQNMFVNVINFNGDLSNWDVSNVTNFENMFI